MAWKPKILIILTIKKKFAENFSKIKTFADVRSHKVYYPMTLFGRTTMNIYGGGKKGDSRRKM